MSESKTSILKLVYSVVSVQRNNWVFILGGIKIAKLRENNQQTIHQQILTDAADYPTSKTWNPPKRALMFNESDNCDRLSFFNIWETSIFRLFFSRQRQCQSGRSGRRYWSTSSVCCSTRFCRRPDVDQLQEFLS